MRSDAGTSTDRRPDHNRTGVDYRAPWPRPKIWGAAIDFHVHLLAERHASEYFSAAAHYGFGGCVTMTPLEEALGLVRRWGDRVLHFIAVPRWQDPSPFWADEWLRRIEAFYNLGSRIVKFHVAPGTMATRQWRLDSPALRPLLREARARGMAIMTHVGDPEVWYAGKYSDAARYGTRDDHYKMWEAVMDEYRDAPWLGAHLGGNPEDLDRLQDLLDRYPNLVFDCSATRWMAREVGLRRDAMREFFLRNEDRIIFGTDQVTGDDRGWDFLASRFWVHRKLWETAWIGPTPILDPDLAADAQPTVRGLALPDTTLQKIYRDNGLAFLGRLGVKSGRWEVGSGR